MFKDLARAVSLANLCFISSWAALVNTTYNIPSFNRYFAILLGVGLLATLFWIVITLARRSRSALALRLARLVFPLVLLIPLNGITRILFPKQLLVIELLMTGLGIVLISLSDITPWNHIVVRTAGILTLVFFPFSLITLFQASWSLTRFSDKPAAPTLPTINTVGSRVIWLVFDELDQQVAFSERPESLHLPELDRLRGQAIYASNAYPPADHTLISMPALITGQLLSKTKLAHPSELMITAAGSERSASWSSQPNLFSRARQAGFNSAVVGWYLPYCRIVGDSLVSCYWYSSDESELAGGLITPIRDLVNTTPLLSILASQVGIIDTKASQRRERQNHLNAYMGVLERAKIAAADPSLGLILLHWPVPHGPSIFNRLKNDFELDGETSYLDNFLLVDRALGDLRRSMEEAGTWDETIVLVTSDHWWRDDIWRTNYPWTEQDRELSQGHNDHRIPFVLKLARQSRAVEYGSEFNTIVTHDLLLALLKGELSDAESVINWLDQRRSTAGNPIDEPK
ncbi:MAG: alkaline phosphatase family protein [Blastocatellia bacterium]